MSTYHPMILECYGCYKPFKDGDDIVSFYEHYLHVGCCPVHLLELKTPFKWRKV